MKNENIEQAKKSCVINFSEDITSKDLHKQGVLFYKIKKIVLKGIASNVKMGPFKATSGVILPYYLNATTNFLDKNIAPLVIEIFIDYLENKIKSTIPEEYFKQGKKALIVGMEVAGGIIVSQLASSKSKINEWADFCYVRKAQKKSGTCQQLEGPNEFTKRNSKSDLLYSIWVDDALSTGSSLLEGIQMLKSVYNIDVVSSLYLCDRSKDRKNLSDEKQYLSHELFEKSKIYAIYDLQEIDELIEK
eukprot:gene8191-19_t